MNTCHRNSPIMQRNKIKMALNRHILIFHVITFSPEHSKVCSGNDSRNACFNCIKIQLVLCVSDIRKTIYVNVHPLTPYSYQEPLDSRFRYKIVCHTHGVGRDRYTHEVIDAHPHHTEEGHQEEIVKNGRDHSTHNLNVDMLTC